MHRRELRSPKPSGNIATQCKPGYVNTVMVDWMRWWNSSERSCGVRVIPQWAQAALAKRLEEPEQGFESYGAVQQWLAQNLAVEAEYHTVYQMTRYRLQAKLKFHHRNTKSRSRNSQSPLKKTCR
nr:hypothetical protein [Amazonocrinis nigriterrae]